MTDIGHTSLRMKGVYRHNKTGKLYEVIGVAFETEREEAMVIYKPLYEHDFGYELFTRPLDMFNQMVTLHGKKVPRFEKVTH